VARATVQAALKVLHAERLIVTRKGSGTFVVDKPDRAARPVPPMIRVHRYEPVLAIKWPYYERWLWVWANEYSAAGEPAADTEWRPLLYDDMDDRQTWIDPTTCDHTDLTRWTHLIREQLDAAVRGTLDMIDQHPWNGGWTKRPGQQRQPRDHGRWDEVGGRLTGGDI